MMQRNITPIAPLRRYCAIESRRSPEKRGKGMRRSYCADSYFPLRAARYKTAQWNRIEMPPVFQIGNHLLRHHCAKR